MEAPAADAPASEGPAPEAAGTASALSTQESAATPTISSGRPDFPPGATVTLKGRNWEGDDEVAIIVNDTLGKSWSKTATVAVSRNGRIEFQFDLPNYFVSDYDVTATGAQSGRVATSTFTDAAKDFSLDFAAATPSTYNHNTGGGFWGSGSSATVVESLQGGDFVCGDIVTFFTRIAVGGTDNDQQLDLTFNFLLDSTGQTGTALGPVTNVSLNTNPPDSGVNGLATLGPWSQNRGTVIKPPIHAREHE